MSAATEARAPAGASVTSGASASPADRADLIAALPELLALLAHDLKNPLAAVLANLAYLDDSVASDPDLRDALADARLASELLQRLVSNLEMIGRELGDGASGRPLEFSLRALVEEICAGEREHAEGRHLLIVVRDAPGSDVAVSRSDRDRAARALGNLLANAVQHAPSGSEITIDCACVGERWFEIAISDDGPIVPEAMRAQAVAPAGQGTAKSRSDGRYGRGLGLLIAAMAARHARGELELGQRAGRSALVLRLPLAELGG